MALTLKERLGVWWFIRQRRLYWVRYKADIYLRLKLASRSNSLSLNRGESHSTGALFYQMNFCGLCTLTVSYFVDTLSVGAMGSLAVLRWKPCLGCTFLSLVFDSSIRSRRGLMTRIFEVLPFFMFGTTSSLNITLAPVRTNQFGEFFIADFSMPTDEAGLLSGPSDGSLSRIFGFCVGRASGSDLDSSTLRLTEPDFDLI